jgi:L-threonylcarbamoyladenylate synthase
MPSTRVMRASPAVIQEASAALAAGALVAFPTETVYGLGADATNDAAIARLYEAKQRPAFNPLIVHVADAAAAERIAEFDAPARALARAFWPGALTLVLPKHAACPVGLLVTAGLDTVALRVPVHPVAHAILVAFGRPVAAPSANRSGTVSPTMAGHVRADLDGRVDLIVDGGPSPLGIESTILAWLDEPVLLRSGAICRERIEAVLGLAVAAAAAPVASDAGQTPRAPGMLPSHYAPHAALRINAVSVKPGEALLAFGPLLPEGADRATMILNLSPDGDLAEAAASLFAHLRALDATGVAAIAVVPIPEHGLGEAINDRLRRAAAPREPAARPGVLSGA